MQYTAAIRKAALQTASSREKKPLAVVFPMLLIFCMLCPCRTHAFSADTCQQTADAFQALTAELEIPWYFYTKHACKTGREFDANDYFTVLRRLSVTQGSVIDYVYKYDYMGGYPVLYVRGVRQFPYVTYARYLRNNNGIESRQGYCDSIIIDDTEEGYFEFVLLRQAGGQFYLHWHAGYDDEVLVCSPDGLNKILENIEHNESGIALQEEAAGLNPAPDVEIGDDAAVVRVMYFTKWGGFIEGVYTVSRAFPHTVIAEEHTALIPYDCGWRY